MRRDSPGRRRARAHRGAGSKSAFNRLGVVASLLTVLVALAGCGADKGSVSIISPTIGATVEPTFTANVSLKDFEIDPSAIGRANAEGKGHLHFVLDGGRYDHPNYSGADGELAAKLGSDGKYSPSVQPAITYQNVPAGRHTLEVFLANNDGSNAGPKSSVTFDVAPAQVGVSISRPREGSKIGDTFTAKVTLENFQIDRKAIGKANEVGKGHLHFALDDGRYDHPKYSGANGRLAVKLGVDGMYSPSFKPTITYRHIPAGAHALVVYLANNDLSRAGAEARASFTVR